MDALVTPPPLYLSGPLRRGGGGDLDLDELAGRAGPGWASQARLPKLALQKHKFPTCLIRFSCIVKCHVVCSANLMLLNHFGSHSAFWAT